LKPSSEQNAAYQVVLADTAKADAYRVYDWLIERAPFHGPRWFDELLTCLYSLENQPCRCPLAREAEEAKRNLIQYQHIKTHRTVKDTNGDELAPDYQQLMELLNDNEQHLAKQRGTTGENQ